MPEIDHRQAAAAIMRHAAVDVDGDTIRNWLHRHHATTTGDDVQTVADLISTGRITVTWPDSTDDGSSSTAAGPGSPSRAQEAAALADKATPPQRAARWRDIALTRPGYATYPDTAPGTPSWWARQGTPPPAVSWAHQPDPRPLADIPPARPMMPILGPGPEEAVAPYAGSAMTLVWHTPPAPKPAEPAAAPSVRDRPRRPRWRLRALFTRH